MHGHMGPVEEVASQLLRGGGHLRVKARGGSMIPFIRDGDLVLVSPAGRWEVLVGDVICYEMSPGRLFLHRVMKREGEQFVAKGDALEFTDLVSSEQVLGKVVAIERHGRVRWLDTRPARWRNVAMVCLAPFLPRLLQLLMRMRRIWRAALCG